MPRGQGGGPEQEGALNKISQEIASGVALCVCVCVCV